MGSKHVVKFRYCGNKIWKNLPYLEKKYFVTSKQNGRFFFQIVVAFSEYLNFNKIVLPQFHEKSSRTSTHIQNMFSENVS